MVELVDTLPWGGSGQIHGCASSSLVRRTIKIKEDPQGLILFLWHLARRERQFGRRRSRIKIPNLSSGFFEATPGVVASHREATRLVIYKWI